MMFPTDWYWLSDDGRVYASARQAIVDDDDAGFAEASALGNFTRWPADDAGCQTDAALQSVLDPFGLFVSLVAYAADRRWQVEVGGITVAGVPVATDDRSKLMIAGARLAAMADPDWTTPWHGTDGGIYPLDAAAIVAISDAVSAHVQASFETFASVKAGIDSGTITTTSQIDESFG